MLDKPISPVRYFSCNPPVTFAMPVFSDEPGAVAQIRFARSLRLPKVSVHITPKPTLLDAQGRTVRDSLRSLGFSGIGDVRIGKIIELSVDGDPDSVREEVTAMCEKLLANPVTEDFAIELEGA
jgi:phosphoribosylformylglycinamidine synthase subunit PurS